MGLIKKIKEKLLSREVIMYLIFGVLTTLVNLVIYFVLVNVFSIEENTSNIIAIVVAIIFAYVTNCYIVFRSKRNSIKERVVEFFKFIFARIFTMVFEIVGFYLMFNILGITDIITKLFITFFVVVLNYFISKVFVFK